MFHIFEFDLTLTKKDTMGQDSLADHAQKSHDERYIIGRTKASSVLKSGLETFIQHTADHPIAIVSSHNNPAFIAGMIAHQLGRKLKKLDTISSAKIAIDIYTVEDEDKPLLISYIPATGSEFAKTLADLDNIVPQIIFLRKTAREMKIVAFMDDIDVYHGSSIEGLDPHIKSHQIHKIDSIFRVLQAPGAGKLDDSGAPRFFKPKVQEESALFGLAPEGCNLM